MDLKFSRRMCLFQEENGRSKQFKLNRRRNFFCKCKKCIRFFGRLLPEHFWESSTYAVVRTLFIHDSWINKDRITIPKSANSHKYTPKMNTHFTMKSKKSQNDFKCSNFFKRILQNWPENSISTCIRCIKLIRIVH